MAGLTRLTANELCLQWQQSKTQQESDVRSQVETICDQVHRNGDRALIEFTRRFDHVELTASELPVSVERITAANAAVSADWLQSLELAIERVRDFHQPQLPSGYDLDGGDGSGRGQRWRPIDRVGIYIPGGRAPLASSLVMNAVPARLAGVGDIIVCTPPQQDGSVAPEIMAAAHCLGIDQVYRIGGAQAVAAMAYGTETVPGVDKITGPGNRYVTEAKRQVFGRVGIDGLPGPSELVVIASEAARPAWVAADLMAQAEHDPEAKVALITWDEDLIDAVNAELEPSLHSEPRFEQPAAQQPQAQQPAAQQSLDQHGWVVTVNDVNGALALSDKLAPEHLSLQIDPGANSHTKDDAWESILSKIHCAGSVFLGPRAAAAYGDYVAGPNHVLPTDRTARFASPLGVLDFMTSFSYYRPSQRAALELSTAGQTLAAAEGLPNHARSMRLRAQPVGLNRNENPYGVVPVIKRQLRKELQQTPFERYPDQTQELMESLSDYTGVPANGIIPTNGGDEAIQLIIAALRRQGEIEQVVAPGPTFGFYHEAAEALNIPYVEIALNADEQGWPTRLPWDRLKQTVRQTPSLVILCQPNNPTGHLYPDEQVRKVLALPQTWVLVDEAYYEFAGRTLAPALDRYPNLFLIRTFSKAFGLAGLRLGYLLAQPSLAERVRGGAQPYNVNSVAQRAGLVALSHWQEQRQTVEKIIDERDRLFERLQRLPGCDPCPSQANFILVRVQPEALEPGSSLAGTALATPTAGELAEALYRETERCGYRIRRLPHPQLDDKVRISVGRPEENDGLIHCLETLLNAPATREGA